MTVIEKETVISLGLIPDCISASWGIKRNYVCVDQILTMSFYVWHCLDHLVPHWEYTVLPVAFQAQLKTSYSPWGPSSRTPPPPH